MYAPWKSEQKTEPVGMTVFGSASSAETTSRHVVDEEATMGSVMKSSPKTS